MWTEQMFYSVGAFTKRLYFFLDYVFISGTSIKCMDPFKLLCDTTATLYVFLVVNEIFFLCHIVIIVNSSIYCLDINLDTVLFTL